MCRKKFYQNCTVRESNLQVSILPLSKRRAAHMSLKLIKKNSYIYNRNLFD